MFATASFVELETMSRLPPMLSGDAEDDELPRQPLLDRFSQISVEPPERCESPSSAMLCECAARARTTSVCASSECAWPMLSSGSAARCWVDEPISTRRHRCRGRQARAAPRSLPPWRGRSSWSEHPSPTCAGTIESPAGLDSPQRCESPSDALKALWLDSQRCAPLARSPASRPTPPRASLTRATVCNALRKRGCRMRYSAPCVETAAWLSDDSSPAFERAQSSSLPEPLAPTVSLSPQLHRGTCAAAVHATACDGAQPSVRWSCPALVMGAERAAVDSRLLRAGGFCSQAPLKRLHEQAFDTGALLRMST